MSSKKTVTFPQPCCVICVMKDKELAAKDVKIEKLMEKINGGKKPKKELTQEQIEEKLEMKKQKAEEKKKQKEYEEKVVEAVSTIERLASENERLKAELHKK